MSAYVLIQATIKNPDRLKEYAAIAGPSVKAAGGEFVTAGQVVEVLSGDHTHERAIVIRFPDADAARAWYRSDAYQSAIPIRNEAMDAVFVLAEDPQP